MNIMERWGWRSYDKPPQTAFSSVVVGIWPALDTKTHHTGFGGQQIQPARRLAHRVRSSLIKCYIAVPAYHVDLLRRPDDRAAYRADVLDAPVLAGLASSPDGGRGFLTAFVAVALGLDLEQGFAAGSNILHAGLLGQPRRRFRGQRRDRPAVGGVLLDV